MGELIRRRRLTASTGRRRVPLAPGRRGRANRRRQPRATSGCCGRWPTWTTCASGSIARSCENEPPSGHGSRPSGCPLSTISTERSSTSSRMSRTVWPPVRGRATAAPDVLARLGFPASRTSASASTPPARGRRRDRGRRSRRHHRRRRAARLRHAGGDPAPGRGRGGRGPDGPPGLLRGAGSRPRRHGRRHPERAWQAGPDLPPRRQQGTGCGGPLQGGVRGLRRAVRSRTAPPLRRLRPRLPAGARRGRPGPGRACRPPAGARARTGTAEPGEEWFTSGVDFEDLFGDMFGGGRRRSGPIPGPTRRPC